MSIRRKRKFALMGGLGAIVALGANSMVFAQDDAGSSAGAVSQGQGAKKANALEEVTVTGTRIRRDDFSNPQPTTVVGGAMIENLGLVNAGDVMAQLPSNVGSYTPTAKPGGNESYPTNVFNGLSLANLRGLNPTYGTRTLTLVDSRRHVPTNQGDAVDLNMIPTILIDRMEVVTGGASASYGSGAIGGVVNILLDRDLDGIKAQVDFGTTQIGGAGDKHYGFAYGTDIGNAGHFVIGVEGENMDAVYDCIEKHAWCAKGAQIVSNPGYKTNSEPNYVYRENVRRNINTFGVFPALGLTFDATGTQLEPFAVTDNFSVGGDGEPIYLDTTLRSNVDRKVGYAIFKRNLTDTLQFWVDASGGKVKSYTPQDAIDVVNAKIAADNFYLNQLPVNPCASDQANCRISKDFTGQINPANDTETSLDRVAFGFTGQYGESTWSYDTYYQYGESKTLQAVYQSQHAERFRMALDAVDDGTGHPVCRVTRDGFYSVYGADTVVDPRLADGCVPIDIFGTSAFSPAAFDYTVGQIKENTDVTQNMVEFVSSGNLYKGFGNSGPLRAAAGLSYRDESLSNLEDTSQPDYLRTDYNSQFGESFGGTVDVLEYFGELDVPASKKLDLHLAARHSDYENKASSLDSGYEGRTFNYSIDTWKVNADWRALDVLRLRASQSRDIRAPNFRELFYAKKFPAGSLYGFCNNPWTGNVSQGFGTFTGDACVVDLHGGITLKPESADTTTLGFVITPPNRTVRLAVDYYDIQIKDAITPASTQLTLDSCFYGRDPTFCSQITGTLVDPNDPLGGFSDIESINPEAMNLRSYRTKGLDISTDWLHQYSFGSITSRVIASHMIDQLIQPSTSSPRLENIAGVTGSPGGGADWEPAANWAVQWITSYSRDAFSITTQARFVSSGKVSADRVGPQDPGYNPNAINSIDNNRVPSYVIWALSGSYKFAVSKTALEFFGSVQNLFDKDPPLIGNGIGGTNTVFFDTLGRTYRLGLRAKF